MSLRPLKNNLFAKIDGISRFSTPIQGYVALNSDSEFFLVHFHLLVASSIP